MGKPRFEPKEIRGYANLLLLGKLPAVSCILMEVYKGK